MKTIDGVSVSDELYTEAVIQDQYGRRMLLGFAEDDEATGCSNCNGAGVIMLSWITDGPFPMTPPTGSPIWHDNNWWKSERKSYPCPICRISDTGTIKSALASDSGLQLEELSYRLDYIEGLEGKTIALNEANMILAQAPLISGFHTFFGDYGVGKSGILKSIVASLIAMGVKARYVRANELLTTVRSTYDNKDVDEIKQMKIYSGYQLLAIDEIDRVSTTDWAKATLFAILDDRYNMRNRRATLLATNEFPDQMGNDWEYLMSRMKDGARIPVGGVSLRGGTQDGLNL
jgi:hypothetical protein